MKKARASLGFRLEKELRQKFVRISFSIVFVVLSAIALLVNGFNYLQVTWKAQALAEIIASNNGAFPSPLLDEMMPPEGEMAPPQGSEPPEDHPQGEPPAVSPFVARIHEETSFTTRFFTINLDKSESIVGVDTSNIHRVSPHQAEMMAMNLFQGGSVNQIDNHFFCTTVEKDDGILMIFVDVSEDLYFFHSFLVSSLVICAVSLVCVLILLLCLSKKAVSPIVEAYAKQKVFITDVSHELKTPLAIMKANTEVLELEYGESNWTESCHRQITKLNLLIQRLLSLAKLEESQRDFAEFSLSQVVAEAGENVRVLMEQEGKDFQIEVSEGLRLVGDVEGIRQLLDILLDNAVKYSSDGVIRCSLKEEKHSYLITVENFAPHLEQGSYDQWFQRFYREDASRNSGSGGFGLGLSMAKTLVRHHHGKITAFSPEGETIVIRAEFKK